MKKDIKIMPAIYPMPVLMVATYDENGKVDVMNAAWGMAEDTDQIVLFLSEDHKTVKNIRANKAFTVSLADEAHMAEADYFGIASGNKVGDKFERTGMTAIKSEKVNAPIIDEFPIVMECELVEEINSSIHAIVGKIKGVMADEKAVNEKGGIDTDGLDILLFNQFNSGYYKIGEKAGQAWNAGLPLHKGE